MSTIQMLPTEDTDGYDYGIDKTDMSIHIIKTEDEIIELEDGYIKNPFFVGINGGNLKIIDFSEIYSKFNKIYILCFKNNFTESKDLYNIYNYIISYVYLEKIKSELILLPASLSILKNYELKNRGCIVENNILETMFSKSFEKTEIIIPMFELTEDIAKLNISLYDSQIQIDDLSKIVALTNIFNTKYKKPIEYYIVNMISHMKELNFWSDKDNCVINMTKIFEVREFTYKASYNNKILISITDKKTNIDTKKIISAIASRKSKDCDYLNMIAKYDKNKEIFGTLMSSGKRTYYIKDDFNMKIDKDDFTKLIFSITDEYILYELVNNFIVSKDYCHLVLNNEKVLDRLKPLFDKYKPVYKVLFGYAWLSMILDESIIKTRTTDKHRFVFDINTANKLPTFPFVSDDLLQNPYISMLVKKDVLNASKNVLSLNNIIDFPYGVCNLDTFKQRFNLMVSGNTKIDIFRNIKWESFAISGSIITACLQEKSPLFNSIAKSTNTPKQNWINFFNTFYKESDIDLMCNEQSIYTYLEKVSEFIVQLNKNIPDATINIEPVKSMSIILSKHFFSERLDDFNDKYGCCYTLDEFIRNIDSFEIREYIYAMYVENKTKLNNIIRESKCDTNPYINNFLNIIPIDDIHINLITNDTLKKFTKHHDSDISLYVNDFKDGDEIVNDDNNYLIIRFCESIKFKISSDKFNKTIELFRSKSKNFFNIVSKFHLPCVRAYYQGDNVYILPSCITSMMTGINIDYKYFAGLKDPVNIINKYRMRGFGTLLSPKEINRFISYNLTNDDSNNIFKIESNEKSGEYLGEIDINNKMYRPEEQEYQIPDYKYIKNMLELKTYYKEKYNYDYEKACFNIFNMKTISDDGNIVPYQSWISHAYYKYINALD